MAKNMAKASKSANGTAHFVDHLVIQRQKATDNGVSEPDWKT